MLTLEWAVRSDAGRRAHNEDAVFATRRLAAVADGVGGAAAGEVASQAVVQSLGQPDKSRLGESLMLEDDVLPGVLSARPDRRACADRLVALARAAGARDNVSAIVVDVVARPQAPPAWPPPL